MSKLKLSVNHVEESDSEEEEKCKTIEALKNIFKSGNSESGDSSHSSFEDNSSEEDRKKSVKPVVRRDLIEIMKSAVRRNNIDVKDIGKLKGQNTNTMIK